MRFCVLVFSLFVLGFHVFAQNPEAKLKELGFENICVCVSNDTMCLSIDDPVYRGTFRGAGIALKHLYLLCPAIKKYELVVKHDNANTVVVHASVDSGKWDLRVDYNDSEYKRIVSGRNGSNIDNYNSSAGKVNVTFYPIVSLDNHVTYKLFDVGLMIATSIETTLWKGSHLYIQPIIPVYDNYEEYNRGGLQTHVQLGSVNLQQEISNTSRWSGRISAGYFHYNYVGFAFDAKYHVSKQFDIGARLGAVRTQMINDEGWKYGHKNLYDALFQASFYEPYSSVEVALRAGRFLYGDYGCRLDGICHFGEYAIGVYGVYSGGEYNGGFHFSIPVAGKKQERMGVVSLRLPDFFDWEYNMVSNYDWVYKKCGKDFEPNAARNRSANYWQAKYIESYLIKYLDGGVD